MTQPSEHSRHETLKPPLLKIDQESLRENFNNSGLPIDYSDWIEEGYETVNEFCDYKEYAAGIIELINAINQENIDTLLFSETSARPAAYLFIKTWKLLYPDRVTPAVKYVSTSKRWGELPAADSEAVKDFREPSGSTVFMRDIVGKNILVVDEYSSPAVPSSSVNRAAGYLKMILPEANTITSINLFGAEPHWNRFWKRKGVLNVEDDILEVFGEDGSSTFLAPNTKPSLRTTTFAANLAAYAEKTGDTKLEHVNLKASDPFEYDNIMEEIAQKTRELRQDLADLAKVIASSVQPA